MSTLNLHEVTVVVLVRIRSSLICTISLEVWSPCPTAVPIRFCQKHGTDPGPDLARRLSDPSFRQKWWQFETGWKRSLKNGGLEFKIRVFQLLLFGKTKSQHYILQIRCCILSWAILQKGLFLIGNPMFDAKKRVCTCSQICHSSGFTFWAWWKPTSCKSWIVPFTVHKLLHSFAVPQFKIALEK